MGKTLKTNYHSNEASIARSKELYRYHFDLFMHCDNFVQHRTTQFSLLNTVLFAIAGGLVSGMAPVFEHRGLSAALLIVSLVGFCFSLIWFCSYKRSDLYRQVHRNTLISLDEILHEPYANIEAIDPMLFLGPFSLRDKVMYEGQKYNQSPRGPIGTDWVSRKRNKSSVESISFFSAFLWGIVFVASIGIVLKSYGMLFI